MPSKRTVSLLVALGALSFAACGGGSTTTQPPVGPALTVVSVPPGAGMRVFQVDFLFPQGIQVDSTWGRVEIDPGLLQQTTGISEGRLNVALGNAWVLVNVPVPPASEPAFAVYFDLGLAQAQPLQTVSLHVKHSDRSIGGIQDHVDQAEVWAVEDWAYDAQGIQPVTDPGLPPISVSITDRFDFDTEPTAWYQMTTNAQCAHNQCATMATANALQYLENMGVLTVPHVHAMGLRGDDTLVGQLDTFCGRAVVSRELGDGLRCEEWVDGVFEYFASTALTGLLGHRHQDQGIMSSLPAWDYVAHGSTSQFDGGMPTFDWIFDRVSEGCGVAAAYAYDGGGGHAVRITAAGRDDTGAAWVLYSHDAAQSYSDPTDSRGLENAFCWISDLDADGSPNFGTRNRELIFVWAHVP